MNTIQTYVIGALVIVLVVAGYFYKEERVAHQESIKSLAVAVEVNKANEAAIAKYKEFKAAQDKALDKMAESNEAMEKLRKSLTSSVNKLVATNEKFREWFLIAVDSDAIRVYNETRHISVKSDPGEQASGSTSESN